MSAFKIVVFLIISLTGYALADDFHYPENNDWGGLCDNGKLQSPIDLNIKNSVVGHYSKLMFMDYDRKVRTNVTNTGHSLQVGFGPKYNIRMAAGGLPGTYYLDQMHFHWGSEHTVESQRYALEMHLVHHEARFDGISDAVEEHNGLAVLGVFFYISEEDNPNLDVILKAAKNVQRFPLTVAPIDDTIMPESFLPDTSQFYRYEGSLTTPSCAEAVVWTVFTDALPVSLKQIQEFQAVVGSDRSEMQFNYRPVKSLNARTLVLHSDSDNETGGYASHTTSTLAAIVSAISIQMAQYYRSL